MSSFAPPPQHQPQPQHQPGQGQYRPGPQYAAPQYAAPQYAAPQYAPAPTAPPGAVPPHGQVPSGGWSPQPAGVPKRRRHWMAPTFVGIGALVVGILIGTAAGGSDEPPVFVDSAGSTESTTEVDVTASDEYQALVEERDALQGQVADLEGQVDGLEKDAGAAQDEAEKAAEKAKAPAGLGNGQYIVGDTIEPGRYTMSVEDDGIVGYVDQQDGDDFLAQEVGEPGETIVVDIADAPGSIVTFRDVTGITKLG
ncbi:hypothetical protein IF650_02660 [Cellulosimicrobium terreum]|nr:hypothetical protein [Cellulosimicrobium terreum]